jgi:hypothetical protein
MRRVFCVDFISIFPFCYGGVQKSERVGSIILAHVNVR